MTAVPEADHRGRAPRNAVRPAPTARDPIFWCLGIATAAVHLALLHAPSVPGYALWWVYIDEGYRLYPPLRLLDGQVLFRDLFTAYPPLSYWLHALAFEVLGIRISSVRAVLVASQVTTTLSAYAIARRLMPRGFALAAALLTIAFGIVRLNFGYSGWYVVPLGLLTIVFLFRYLESDGQRRRELFVAGAFAGLALATKLRDGGWTVVAGLTSILVWRTCRDFEPGWRVPTRFPAPYAAHVAVPLLAVAMLGSAPTAESFTLFVLPNLAVSLALLVRQSCLRDRVHSRVALLAWEMGIFGAGVAAVTLPWILYYLHAAGADALYEQLVTVPRGMKDRLYYWGPALVPMRHGFALALIAVAAGVLLVALAAARRAGRWRTLAGAGLGAGILAATALYAADGQVAVAGMYALLPGASGVALLAVGRHWRRPEIPTVQLAVLAVFNGAGALTLYPWTDVNHWLWAAPTMFVIMCFAAGRAGAYGTHLRWVAVACLTIIVAISLQRAFQPPLSMPRTRVTDAPRADVAMDPMSVGEVQKVVDFVAGHVPADEPILEIPGSFYAFVTGHRQASRLDYFWIVDAETWDQAREIETIRRNDPTYALVREDPVAPNWRKAFPAVARYVDQAYAPVAKLGTVSVLRKREASGPNQ